METYVKLDVAIPKDAFWLASLTGGLRRFPVRWQNGHYHITLAFNNKTPHDVDIVSILNNQLRKPFLPEITFDKLEAFTAQTGGQHIINLTSSVIPDDFKEWVDNIRRVLTANGCTIESNFRLHVTLGRIQSSAISLEKLNAFLQGIEITPFTESLPWLSYMEYRGTEPIVSWKLKGR